MKIDYNQIEQNLISEIKLTDIQAKIFLLIVTQGKMSAEQISTLESLEASFKSSLELLHDNFVNGVVDYTPEEYILSVGSIIDSFHEDKITIFDTVQLEIIEIHRAIARRFMKHSRWGHKGR